MIPCFIFASRNTFLFPFLLSQKKGVYWRPYLWSNLVTALAGLQVENFPHGVCLCVWGGVAVTKIIQIVSFRARRIPDQAVCLALTKLGEVVCGREARRLQGDQGTRPGTHARTHTREHIHTRAYVHTYIHIYTHPRTWRINFTRLRSNPVLYRYSFVSLTGSVACIRNPLHIFRERVRPNSLIYILIWFDERSPLFYFQKRRVIGFHFISGKR